MELTAKVYAAAKSEVLLKKLYSIMQECVPVIKQEGFYFSRNSEIDGWVELEEKEFDVWDRGHWDTMLERCGKEGTVGNGNSGKRRLYIRADTHR